MGEFSSERIEQPSFCRICNAMCGILVTLEGDRVVRVRGDADHPISQGYTCPKGRTLPDVPPRPPPSRPSRDRRPAGRSGTRCSPTSPSVCGRTLEATGPSGVAMYLASGSAFDSTGRRVAERFLRVLGSPQKYTATTIDTPSQAAGRRARGRMVGPHAHLGSRAVDAADPHRLQPRCVAWPFERDTGSARAAARASGPRRRGMGGRPSPHRDGRALADRPSGAAARKRLARPGPSGPCAPARSAGTTEDPRCRRGPTVSRELRSALRTVDRPTVTAAGTGIPARRSRRPRGGRPAPRPGQRPHRHGRVDERARRTSPSGCCGRCTS